MIHAGHLPPRRPSPSRSRSTAGVLGGQAWLVSPLPSRPCLCHPPEMKVIESPCGCRNYHSLRTLAMIFPGIGINSPLIIASKTCSSGRSNGSPSIRCSQADPGTRPSLPIRHRSPSIASDARISHPMRLGGVFAVPSLDGVRPADVRRGGRYRGSEANGPARTASVQCPASFQGGCRLFASNAVGVGRNIGTAVIGEIDLDEVGPLSVVSGGAGRSGSLKGCHGERR